MQKEPLTVIFYGVSGSGKGTQAQLLREYLEGRGKGSVLYIETGDRLRKFIKSDGHTQELTKKIMNEGGLLPSFLPIHVWTIAFIEEFTGKEHLIMDGLARREYEAPTLDSALWFYGRGNYHIIEFTLSYEDARARLLERERGDDVTNQDAIRRKFEWYEETVRPAIEYFEKSGRPVHKIDAAPGIEHIHKEVLEKLGLT